MSISIFNKTKTDVPAKNSRPELHGSVGHHLATDPFLDWVLILASCLVIAIALVGVGISVYFDTESRLAAFDISPDKKAAMPLNEELLSKVLSQYGTRAAEQSAIRKGSTALNDPSLP